MKQSLVATFAMCHTQLECLIDIQEKARIKRSRGLRKHYRVFGFHAICVLVCTHIFIGMRA